MKNGTEDVKRHRWFKALDWEEVYYKQLKPPILPKVQAAAARVCRGMVHEARNGSNHGLVRN